MLHLHRFVSSASTEKKQVHKDKLYSPWSHSNTVEIKDQVNVNLIHKLLSTRAGIS